MEPNEVVAVVNGEEFIGKEYNDVSTSIQGQMEEIEEIEEIVDNRNDIIGEGNYFVCNKHEETRSNDVNYPINAFTFHACD